MAQISCQITLIPVPKVYAYSSSKEDPYIAMEYIQGESMGNSWKTYNEDTKEILAREVSKLIVDLGVLRYTKIGGMGIDQGLGPTVEGHKFFKGRVRKYLSSTRITYLHIT